MQGEAGACGREGGPPGPCVVSYTQNAARFLHSFAVPLPCLGESWVLSGGCEFPSCALPSQDTGYVFFFSRGALATWPVQPWPWAGPESAVASLPTDRTPLQILALGPLCSSACWEPLGAHSLALPLDSGALPEAILPFHLGGRSAFLWLCFWSRLPVTC